MVCQGVLFKVLKMGEDSVKAVDYRSDDCLNTLNWRERGHCPRLSEIYDKWSFKGAMDVFVQLTDLGQLRENVSGNFRIDSVREEVNDCLVRTITPRGGGPEERSRLGYQRGENWNSVAGNLLDYELLEKMAARDRYYDSKALFASLSNELGVMTAGDFDVRKNDLRNLAEGGLGGLMSAYHMTTLATLLYPRPRIKRVPYVEPKPGSPFPENLRLRLKRILSGSPILGRDMKLDSSSLIAEKVAENKALIMGPYDGLSEVGVGDDFDFSDVGLQLGKLSDLRFGDYAHVSNQILSRYNTKNDGAESYPIERLAGLDPNKIRDYCYVLLRMLLGRKADFSSMLQESFIVSEVVALAKKYYPKCCDGMSLYDAEIKDIVDELFNIRCRAFEHTNLLTTRYPRSGIIIPPANLFGDNVGKALDCGSGPWARYFNGLARAYPGGEYHAVDKKIGGSYNLAIYNSPQMNFHSGDFNDRDSLAGMLGHFGRESMDVVNMSNILHKLSDPIGFMRFVFRDLLRAGTGMASICMPIVSSYQDGSNRRIGLRSLAAMGVEDTTVFSRGFLTIEKFLEVVREMGGMSIVSMALADPRFAQNDTAQRVFITLKKTGQVA